MGIAEDIQKYDMVTPSYLLTILHIPLRWQHIGHGQVGEGGTGLSNGLRRKL